MDNPLFDWLEDISIGTERAATVGICSLTSNILLHFLAMSHSEKRGMKCTITRLRTWNAKIFQKSSMHCLPHRFATTEAIIVVLGTSYAEGGGRK